MQDPAAANDSIEVAHPGMRRRQRCQPFCQRVVKRPGALFATGLPAQPLLPERRHIQLAVAYRQRDRMANRPATQRQSLQPTGGLPLVAELRRGATCCGGHGIKQPSGGRGCWAIHPARNRPGQRLPGFIPQRIGLGQGLPLGHKSLPLGQQVAPRLARRQIAAGQCHRRQAAEPVTAT